jgi:hypothetical protein
MRFSGIASRREAGDLADLGVGAALDRLGGRHAMSVRTVARGMPALCTGHVNP